MDALFLSRLQFAVATYFHFLFVPLTLGLSLLVAIMETLYVRRGDEQYLRMARFWGKIFLTNFVVGVVTGITLEFQFGTNWSAYSRYVGDIFGSLLAIEATAAFFLESTFIAVWALGWKRLSAKAHAASIWLVALASNLSAVWILVANSWMQHPVGYALRAGRAELTDFWAVITQKYATLTILHTLGGAYVLTGFFVMGMSAYHLLRGQHVAFFKRSFRMGLSMALVFSVFVMVEGHFHGADLAEKQPTKLAALEALWETQPKAPIYLLALPSPSNDGNLFQLGRIPGAMSLLAHHDPEAVVKGLRDFPKEERPPVLLTFVSFRLMVGLGALFLLLAVVGWFKRHRLESSPGYLRLILWATPLPYLACAFGWTVAEVGRQPWIVYGLLRTQEAVSPISPAQVAVTLAGFVLLYSVVGLLAFWLIARYVRQGPEPETSVGKS
ncbi:MAG: cytochrome ubiquinol oxidase subunit I [Thermodesulfobacteriota bacterium]